MNADDAIRLLNEMLVADRDAIEQLVNHHVVCNDVLGEHPTVQTELFVERHSAQGKSEFTDSPISYRVGMLGIINGLFGVDEKQNGFIAARFDDKTRQLIAFERYRG